MPKLKDMEINLAKSAKLKTCKDRPVFVKNHAILPFLTTSKIKQPNHSQTCNRNPRHASPVFTHTHIENERNKRSKDKRYHLRHILETETLK